MKVSPSKSIQRARSTLLLLDLLLDPCPSLLILWGSWRKGAPVDWDGIGSLRGLGSGSGFCWDRLHAPLDGYAVWKSRLQNIVYPVSFTIRIASFVRAKPFIVKVFRVDT